MRGTLRVKLIFTENDALITFKSRNGAMATSADEMHIVIAVITQNVFPRDSTD